MLEINKKIKIVKLDKKIKFLNCILKFVNYKLQNLNLILCLIVLVDLRK